MRIIKSVYWGGTAFQLNRSGIVIYFTAFEDFSLRYKTNKSIWLYDGMSRVAILRGKEAEKFREAYKKVEVIR